MLKKILTIALSLTLTTLSFSGCNNSSPDDSASSTSDNASSEKLPETDEEWEAAMLERSLVSYGNTTPMKEKIEKAKNGEEITIGYLGGSITEGYTVKPDECYASLSYNAFKDMYGGDNVKYCNAGLSGTPSRLGILRMGRDLLPSDPDIVFVEYAVNDGTDFTYQEAYESIIRTLLERDVAVVLLFSVTKDDYSAQDYMKDIGTYYDLPMISYCDALRFLFENDRLKWSDFSNDEAHPNPDGHKLVASMIENYFKTVTEQESGEYTIPQEPKNLLLSYGATMYEGDALEAQELGSFKQGDTDVATFNNGWRHLKTGGEPIKFSLKGKNVFMIYKEVGGGSYATVEVIARPSEGDEDETLVNAVKANGWGGPQVAQIATSDTEQEYEITIAPIPGDEEKSFQILGFGVTD
ncbi:MAG: SGNH/GDSL hydrolase family protein [Ruminococcus sp.]|nr:SGNH/GDSL hydrolase family protein [Ruminococcus sp.]MBR1750331.1 SGNH/GDSL hydrolase family protein [Ruminococcus sp.]